jgi:hypothetical protein
METRADEPSMSLMPAGDENFLRGIFWEDEADRPLLHTGDLVMSPASKTSYLRCLITKLPPGPAPIRLHIVAIASDTGSLEIALEEQDGEFRENWVARVPIEPGHNRTDLILKPSPEGQLLRSPRSFNGDGVWNPNGMPVQFHLRYPSGDCRISKLELIFPATSSADKKGSETTS